LSVLLKNATGNRYIEKRMMLITTSAYILHFQIDKKPFLGIFS